MLKKEGVGEVERGSYKERKVKNQSSMIKPFY